jgi:LacI family transcriptional regulator
MFNVNATAGLRTIRLDDTEAARIATEHLIKLGHQAIVYMGDEGATSERRYEGYKAALADGGLPPQPPVLAGASPDTSHDTTLRFLRSGGVATAFVAFSTTCAVGVHSGIIAAGRRVPDDLSLVSIQDAWLARHLNPPLTVVSLPFSELGAIAVSILIDQISDPDEGETIVDDTPPRLVVRGSTKARTPH